MIFIIHLLVVDLLYPVMNSRFPFIDLLGQTHVNSMLSLSAVVKNGAKELELGPRIPIYRPKAEVSLGWGELCRVFPTTSGEANSVMVEELKVGADRYIPPM